MNVENVYHDVKLLLRLSKEEIDNLRECGGSLRDLNDPFYSVIKSAFIEHPSPSYSGFMTRFVERLKTEGTPSVYQICGYDALYVLYGIAKHPNIMPPLKTQIDNLWNAFETHRKLLETFKYETKV